MPVAQPVRGAAAREDAGSLTFACRDVVPEKARTLRKTRSTHLDRRGETRHSPRNQADRDVNDATDFCPAP
jgi:hypothetical protein